MGSGRLRVALGLVLAIGGSLWLAGGPVLIGEVARVGLRAVPVVLVVVSVGVILRLAVPRGSLTGPMLLLAVGVLGLGYQAGLITSSAWRVVPALVIVVGVMLALTGRGERHPIALPVRRYTSVLLPSLIEEEGQAPVHALVRCLLGRVELDLSGTSFPNNEYRLTIDVTIAGGSVTITVPHDWTLRPGPRLYLAHGTRFSGSVTSTQAAPDHPDEIDPRQKLVVLNVRGLGGFVGVVRDYSDDPLSAADDPAASGGGG